MNMAQEKRDKQPYRLTVTLDERDRSEVCQLAEENQVSAAWIIRRAVQYFLRDMPRPLNRLRLKSLAEAGVAPAKAAGAASARTTLGPGHRL